MQQQSRPNSSSSSSHHIRRRATSNSTPVRGNAANPQPPLSNQFLQRHAKTPMGTFCLPQNSHGITSRKFANVVPSVTVTTTQNETNHVSQQVHPFCQPDEINLGPSEEAMNDADVQAHCEITPEIEQEARNKAEAEFNDCMMRIPNSYIGPDNKVLMGNKDSLTMTETSTGSVGQGSESGVIRQSGYTAEYLLHIGSLMKKANAILCSFPELGTNPSPRPEVGTITSCDDHNIDYNLPLPGSLYQEPPHDVANPSMHQ